MYFFIFLAGAQLVIPPGEMPILKPINVEKTSQGTFQPL